MFDDDTSDPNQAVKHLNHKLYSGMIIAAGAFKGGSADAIVVAGDADLVVIGPDYIANPYLPEPLRRRLPLNPYDRETFTAAWTFTMSAPAIVESRP